MKVAAPLEVAIGDVDVRIVMPPVARFVHCGAPACFRNGVVQWGFGFATILDSNCGCGGRGVIGGVLLLRWQLRWNVLTNDEAVRVGCQYFSQKLGEFSPLRCHFCDVSFGLIPCAWLLLCFGAAVCCCCMLLF